ncbi:MAG: precorrin-6y C5,15-methyltransferase (decarboxylating) subunit CbiE, partial [Streptosporangiaceae bacterium]
MITVIGCDGGPLGPQAQAALAAAATVAGAPRHLDTVPLPHTCERIEIKRLDDALDAITAPRPGDASVVVLASGDPGFFGIVRALRARGERPRVIPAVSSVALAFARLGLDWDDALVVSAHGRDPRPVLAAALAHPKAAILTAPGTAATLAAELIAAGRAVYAAELLGTPQEKLTDLSAAPGATPADPNVLITVAPSAETSAEARAVTAAAAAGPPRWLAGHPGAPDRWALPEDAFEHRDSMITKAEVRALVLARLGPGPGRTIWDVGAGSGSVAVECARFGAWVIAVEADQAQCQRIRANAAAHGVYLRVQPGRAPGVLA